ncbi:radical SAM protein [bacterium]|nr:radical SAM protein [bacterium]
MKEITRKSLLYKTGVEYGDYTINHVLGCYHGCLYPCYAFLLAKRFGKVKSYEEWCEPAIVGNALTLLRKEIPKMKDRITSVQLCFTTDPFMLGYPEVIEMSIKIIDMLNKNDIPVVALTKGILPTKLEDYSKSNIYGITLISLDEDFRKIMEPNAASYSDRINSLRYLHEKGFNTWVSIEPYPTPNIIEQDIYKILDEINFVDKIIFGRLHYNSKVSQYKGYKEFYNELADIVVKYCIDNGIDYHIKNKTIS